MCTLTWFRTDSDYQIFFNRDEQRSRHQAIPPQALRLHGTEVLMPTDPTGGGSWIAVNEHGVSLCLLNYYHSAHRSLNGDTGAPDAAPVSRGQLVRGLAHLPDIHGIETALSSTVLSQFAAFTLVAFAPSTQAHEPTIHQRGFEWDGQHLTSFAPPGLMTSSSVKFDEVSALRQQRFTDAIDTNPNPVSLTPIHHALHASHCEDKNYRSICMHREDAKTVSFSHITVRPSTHRSATAIAFDYHDGSPCDTPCTHTICLPR